MQRSEVEVHTMMFGVSILHLCQKMPLIIEICQLPRIPTIILIDLSRRLLEAYRAFLPD